MKKLISVRNLKKFTLLAVALLLFVSGSAGVYTADAHERVYIGTVGIDLKWNNIVNGKCHLIICNYTAVFLVILTNARLAPSKPKIRNQRAFESMLVMEYVCPDIGRVKYNIINHISKQNKYSSI